MTYKELTETVKRRIRHEGVCPVCHQPITEYQDIQYIKYIDGRRKNYVFFHTSCLIEARRAVNSGRV